MFSFQLEKLQSVGYKPILLLGKVTNRKENKCEVLTPPCRLTSLAQEYLLKIGSISEYMFEGKIFFFFKIHNAMHPLFSINTSVFIQLRHSCQFHVIKAGR